MGNHNPLMCDDLDKAKQNRERIARGKTNAFYDEQGKAVAQWVEGTPKPASVIVGELPQVNLRQIRLDTSERLGIE